MGWILDYSEVRSPTAGVLRFMKRTALFVADDPAALGEPGEGDRGLALTEAAGEAVAEGLVHLGGDGFGAETLVGPLAFHHQLDQPRQTETPAHVGNLRRWRGRGDLGQDAGHQLLRRLGRRLERV